MSQITIYKDVNDISGLCIIEPNVHSDSRGFLMEVYNERDFFDAGLDNKFVQDNHAYSVKGVLRGLHINRNRPQGKLVRVVIGTIFDVVVDLRINSKTYKKWYGIELSAENKKQLYIPKDFAHGYLVLSNDAHVLFKVTEHYIGGDEIGIAWNSPDMNIQWPLINNGNYILNSSDACNKKLSELNLD